MYLLQREQRRVMQADQAMMDILSKVMPYKVSPLSLSTLSGFPCTRCARLPWCETHKASMTCLRQTLISGWEEGLQSLQRYLGNVMPTQWP